jgi:hypothetical protein
LTGVEIFFAFAFAIIFSRAGSVVGEGKGKARKEDELFLRFLSSQSGMGNGLS